MLFNRRKPPHFFEKLRIVLWPRRNWWRSLKYVIKRVMRLSASPHVVAIGFAAGAFASITPFVGFHFLLCFLLSFILGGNFIAAALGTAVGNPLTFPFIWIGTYKFGSLLLYGHSGRLDMGQLKNLFLHTSWSGLAEILVPMTVGALPLGLGVGVFFYFLVRRLVFVYQHSRLAKMARRAEERVLDKLLHKQKNDG